MFYVRRSWQKHPERRAAYIIVGNAVRDKRLIKGPCVHCGSLKVQAHHEDYAKPLEVTWMCLSCHTEHHKAERWA
jgi:ribosomal protein S27AE